MAKKGLLSILAAYGACVLVPIMMAGDNSRHATRNADDQGVTKPELIHKVAPVYPEEARKDGVQGEVIVEALIDESGSVKRASVVSESPASLAEAATAAVKQWRYRPATDEQNKPIAVLMKVTIQFRLS